MMKRNSSSGNDILSQAVSSFQAGKLQDAERQFRKVLKHQPRQIAALNLLSIVLTRLERFSEAEPYIRLAAQLNPASDATLYNYGLILKALKRPNEAFQCFSKALKINSSHAETWNCRGTVLNDLKQYGAAVADFTKAIALQPNYSEAYCNKGKSLTELKRYDEALAAYNSALAFRPELAEAWLGCGDVFFRLRRYDEAIAASDKALALKPDLADVEGARIFAKMHLCDWTDFESESDRVVASVANNRRSISPFAFLGISSSSGDQLQCAKLWAAEKFPVPERPIWQGERYKHDRIRVAYLSANFNDHPVAYLMSGVFERHHRRSFETTAICFGADDPGELRTRLKAAFDRFIDVNEQDDLDVARLLRTLEIDIAVDLMGYTADARPAILAHRCSPIQVNYLGYPGTLGAGHIDYLIADPTLIPPPHHKNYSEKIAFVPDSYLPSDASNRNISGAVFDRARFGLPEDGFVFCCFNNSYKLNPNVFAVFMRLLQRVDRGVLWLSETSSTAAANLRMEAAAKGVDPGRLVFAQRLPSRADHLARHRLADLFLDTLPYNAHTTASDALWAGLPVLTQIGQTFAGRVAASLLNAIGLRELIAQTAEEYEKRAIELAEDPAKLAAIKSKLAQNRLSTPLFDTETFTRHIESAYEAMYRRYQAGLPPDHIHVQRQDRCAAFSGPAHLQNPANLSQLHR
jgi:protein O-GlcNAc transferase